MLANASHTFICVNCEGNIPEEEIMSHGEDIYCEDCFHELFTECERCGDVSEKDETYVVDHEVWCEYCYREFSAECDECNEVVHIDDTVCDDYITVCAHCAQYFERCDECYTLIREDDNIIRTSDACYCEDCMPLNEILNYETKPKPRFYSLNEETSKFLGVELEVENVRDEWSNSWIVNGVYEKVNGELYFKHDGSLDDGFEIVSHPCTLEYHTKKLGWENVFSYLVQKGCRSHDTGTCGLHIHVSRKHFGNTIAEQEAHIAKLLYLFEKFWEEITIFSRRTPSQLDRWAKRYLASDESLECLHEPEKELLYRAKSWGKYFAINLEHSHTIEFRVFRGTLKYNTFVATLQFVDVITDLVVARRTRDIQNLSWEEFADLLRVHSRELEQYMRERGL